MRNTLTMKKTISLLFALFLTVGFAVAQDVYFAGHNNGTVQIWRNDSLVYSISDTISVTPANMRIASDSSIYTVGYSYDTAYNFVRGFLWLNDSLVFDAGSNTALRSLVLNGNNWIAAGSGKNDWEKAMGLVWQNGEVLYAYSDSIRDNQINAVAVDTATGDVYSGGLSSELAMQAALWKNDTILWIGDSASATYAIAFDNNDLYATGVVYIDSLPIATLWQNDSIIFQVSDVGIGSSFDVITLYNDSIYLAGYLDDSLCVWRNGEVLYTHPRTGVSEIRDLVVNESGVYYVGQTDSIGTVWKDGAVLHQPEGCDYVNALCVLPTPTPPQPMFTLTVEADTTGWGVVIGGGSYHYGDTATIEAIPNIGCEFLYWNDSVTDNPRDIVITQDSVFTAYFAQIEYLIEANVSPEGSGIVTGGGFYHYGDTIQLEAMPNEGFGFTFWADSVADNPRSVVVTQDSSFVALFDTLRFTVNVVAEQPGWGTVSGGGTYNYGDVVQIAAYNNTGYVFMHWEDGVDDNPRTIVVECDTTFTAIFKPLQFEITTECSPEEGGSVSGAGVYDYGTSVTIEARPNEDYSFVCWSDGAVSNPRQITVTQNAHYKALFNFIGVHEYVVTVSANDPDLGMVTGGGIYPEGSSIQISARPFQGCTFNGWDDGSMDNPRTVIVDSDMSFTALFSQIKIFTISVLSADPHEGSTYGGGTYTEGQVVHIGAIPANGYYFSGWQDGNMDNPRAVIVTENAEYIAFFEQMPIQTFTVNVNCDESQGFVLGAGTSYPAGSTATLAAIPADGYVFVGWGDGSTVNPREIVVIQDIVLDVYFQGTSIGENGNVSLNLYPNPANDQIRIEGTEGMGEAQIYNTMGTLVKTVKLGIDEVISISDLRAGLYLMRIDGIYHLKFVKE